MQSTAIDWMHWHDGILSVKYRDDGAYDYVGVPEDVWRKMRTAPSKGQFVNSEIKPRYSYRKRS